jgi:Ca2+-transporting ATPase
LSLRRPKLPHQASAAPRPPWHGEPPGAVLAALDATPNGLVAAEVAKRQARFGRNALPPPKRDGVLLVYLRQFKSPLIYLLVAAAAVSVALGNLTDAAFIFGVLQVNAVVGAIQEWRAASSAQALMRMARVEAVVLRDGRRQRLDSAELVPGDVVELDPGMHVPADLRLLASRDLQLDESLLTGESTPVFKQSAAVLPVDTALADRRTMAYAGTSVLRGRGSAVVVATGLATELGAIARAMSGGTVAPLLLRLQALARQIAILMTGAIAVIAAIDLLRGAAISDVFFVAVALAVAAIPEGLPVAVTVALSVAMHRMARRGVIVRSLPAVEGLGACTLIASDKTGTLTCNELTVTRLWLPGDLTVDVGGEGYRIEGALSIGGTVLGDAAGAAARRLALAGALANEASLFVDPEEVRFLGDTVDVAFLILAAKLGIDRPAQLERLPQVGTVPYEPHLRFAASFHADGLGGVQAYVKGAAEMVLPMCADRDGELGHARTTADALAAAGYRVLAVAAGPVERDGEEEWGAAALLDLDFLGFACLIDPVRPEVPDAIERARRSGVDVRMVTGDHPSTALAIARQLGLAQDEGEVVTGQALAALVGDDPAHREARDAVIGAARIFARVDAVQKLDIVTALQRQGHFVAVTGDGVNDAPALDAAHIGVAMGRQGTDVARGAADLVIADDNFASIVAGIEEGRIAYDNVRKVTLLLIGTGIGEILLFVLALASGLPAPLTAVQLLWLNLVTNGVQDVALAFEQGERGVLDRPPRPPRQPLFDRALMIQTAVAGGYIGIVGFGFYSWALGAGLPAAEAGSLLLLLMVLFENVHVFNCRSERRSAFAVPVVANPWVVLSVAFAFVLQVAAMSWEGSRDLLHLVPVDPVQALAVIPITFGLLLVMEVYKRVVAVLRRR